MPTYEPPKKRSDPTALRRKLGQKAPPQGGTVDGKKIGQFNLTHEHGEPIKEALKAKLAGGKGGNMGGLANPQGKAPQIGPALLAKARSLIGGPTSIGDKPTSPQLGGSSPGTLTSNRDPGHTMPTNPQRGAPYPGTRTGGPLFTDAKPRKRKPGTTTSSYPR